MNEERRALRLKAALRKLQAPARSTQGSLHYSGDGVKLQSFAYPTMDVDESWLVAVA